MTSIIKENFSFQDFELIVNDFVFNDLRVNLEHAHLVQFRQVLLNDGDKILNLFKDYFKSEEVARFDDLTEGMEQFVIQLGEDIRKFQGEERRAFRLFWQEVADTVDADARRFQDNYLTNSCNYLIHEMKRLS